MLCLARSCSCTDCRWRCQHERWTGDLEPALPNSLGCVRWWNGAAQQAAHCCSTVVLLNPGLDHSVVVLVSLCHWLAVASIQIRPVQVWNALCGCGSVICNESAACVPCSLFHRFFFAPGLGVWKVFGGEVTIYFWGNRKGVMTWFCTWLWRWEAFPVPFTSKEA